MWGRFMLAVLFTSAVAQEGVLPEYPATVLPEVPDAAGGDIGSDGWWDLPEYQASEGNFAQRRWFQEARLGMFIHWGIYANLGRGEWVLHNDKILLSDYSSLAPRFNPVFFNATDWVLLAKNAGMRYITITAKHHDGFCLFHTKQTKWNIVDQGGYGKDIIRELALACKEHGIRLGLYYSPLDWSHPDYYPRGFTGTHTGRTEAGNWSAYLDYMNRQIHELITGYGDLLTIWLDGWWDLPSNDRWRTHETYQMIHRLNPNVLIGNNHHRTPFWGEDIQIFEKDAPGENTKGYAHTSLEVENSLPLETCDTLHHNGAWGYTSDHTPRPIDEVVKLVARTAGFNANLLLNIGPQPDGQIQHEFQETLHQLGVWMRQYGHTIYGTRGGPVPPQSWGVTTHHKHNLWVHILEWHDDSSALHLVLPGVQYDQVFSDKIQVESCHEPLCSYTPGDVLLTQDADTKLLELRVSVGVRDDYDTIIRLTFKNPKDSNSMSKTEL